MADCLVCRKRAADFTVTIDDPVTGRRTALLCKPCLGEWSATQLYLLGGQAVITLEWAPGRLVGHGTGGNDKEEGKDG